MRLEKVVPWGRSKDEYWAMFGLDSACRSLKILGCGDGLASFNAEMTKDGGSVTSVDPIYALSGPDIGEQFEAAVDQVLDQVTAEPEKWVWSFHRNLADLRQHRIATIKRFLADFDDGKKEGRYSAMELPNLGFSDGQFDLALSSHLLFLYSDLLSEEFHVAAIREMCRVAKEVRVFPLLTLQHRPSPHIEAVRREAAFLGFESEFCTVDYEFQKGGNTMLRMVKRTITRDVSQSDNFATIY